MGVTGLLGKCHCIMCDSMISIWSTLCSTSPAPGHRCPKSARVSRHSALPFIWKRSKSSLGKSNSRTQKRKKTSTSSRLQRRGSDGNDGGNCVFSSANWLEGGGGQRQMTSLQMLGLSGFSDSCTGSIFILDMQRHEI